MRPLNLKMQAFGVFLSAVEIPFEKLGANNVYLISGETGSGKTTIFDAICYALFGEPSTPLRTSANLKSDFSEDSTEGFVEFEFLFNGEIYKVTRTLPYQRKKNRGQGYVLEPPKAQIILPDGKMIFKPKEVDNFIKNLLGLELAQFSQIALLAQGEFLKLLNADTQNRGEIFRKIFKTQNYILFQQKLKDKMIENKNFYENLQSSILQYISQINSDNEEINLLKADFIKNKIFIKLDEFLEALENENKKDNDEILKIQKNIEENDKKIISKQKQTQIIQTKLNLILKKQELKKEFEILKSEFNDIQNDYLTLDKRNSEVEKLIIEIRKLDDDYKKSLEIINLSKTLANMESEKKNIENLIQNLKNNLESLKKDHLKNEFNILEKNKNDLKNLQNEFLTFQKEVNKLSDEYELNYNTYLEIQAGILALDLKDNSPCPVCGSFEHPKPAEIKNSQISKDFLEDLKKNLEKQKNLLSKLSENCSLKAQKIALQKDEFEKLSKKYNLKTEFKISEIKKINFLIEIKKNEDEIEENEKKFQDKDVQIKITQTKIDTLKNSIKIKDADLIIQEHEKLKEKCVQKQNEIKKIKEIYDEKNIKLNNCLSNETLLKKQIEELKKVNESDCDKILSEISALELQNKELNEKSKHFLSKKVINDKVIAKIFEQHEIYKEVFKKYNCCKILSDCANGTLKGKPRISFEQYIQGYYLDLVLFEANKHLKTMSKGQFMLLRKQDSTSLQAKTGLELDVMDFHTFKSRSSKTLSGGESFKAALSLALGLSDFVSGFSNAIKIDAMFIDEGFGSLDSDSIELAMDVISNLSSSNRLIGIISHIDDLKSGIQNQITVKKTDSSSFIELTF